MPFGQEKKAGKKETLLLYFTTNVQNKSLEPVITQCTEQLVWTEVKIQQMNTKLLKYFNLSSAMAICLVTLFCLQHAASSFPLINVITVHSHSLTLHSLITCWNLTALWLSQNPTTYSMTSKNTTNTFLKSWQICKAYAALSTTEKTRYQTT